MRKNKRILGGTNEPWREEKIQEFKEQEAIREKSVRSRKPSQKFLESRKSTDYSKSVLAR